MIANLDQIQECVSRYKKKYVSKVKDGAKQIKSEGYDVVNEVLSEKTSNIIAPEKSYEKRREMLEASSIEPVDFAMERAIGKNDSVYSNFIELIASAKEKVGRIAVKEGITTVSTATGFMVSERLLLTNWHVFEDMPEDEVADSEVQFYFELDVMGRETQPVTFRLSPHEFYFSDKPLDYCLLAVEPRDITDTFDLSQIGYLFLDPMIGKLLHDVEEDEEKTELLNIIHHPNGERKQLSIRENQLIDMQPNSIWYKSDTAPGSSGAPVFNDQWQVVALHHMGVPKKSEDGKHYLDRDGNIIEVIDGDKVDLAKVHWIANEGIRISVLLKHVFEHFPDDQFIEGIKIAPPTFIARPFGRQGVVVPPPNGKKKPIETFPQRNPVSAPPSQKPVTQTNHQNQPTMNDSSNVQISFPASLVEANGNVTIHINNKLSLPLASSSQENGSSSEVKPATPMLSDGLFEIKRLEKEFDFSVCEGYQSDFLGIDIPMPRPKAALQKFLARIIDTNETLLKYHHYSVYHHAVRKMPVISAINVDGDPDKRKDETKRKDTWLRDTRLDFEVQLNDKFYRNSGFDKGHLSRREDANWGSTPADAKKFADLTCFYTNACPQVGKLNQSRQKGLWGRLENMIFEKGVAIESGMDSKISVFNGPIFKEDDRVYKGIQIPMEFWKVVLWFREVEEELKLQATAFRLSQADIVDNVQFEKLGFDENTEFQPFQISIKKLEELTHLDFSAMHEFDTFNGGSDMEERQISSEEELDQVVSGD